MKFKKKDNTVGLLVLAVGLLILAFDRKAKERREKDITP